MDKNVYYKNMFIVAALWNWILAIVMVLLSIAVPSMAKDFGVEIPASWFFFHMMWFFAFLIGLLFFATGRNLEKYHGLSGIFILEKVGAFLIGLAYYLIGEINVAGLLIVVVDLIFGFLFIEYWLKFE